MHCSGQSVHVLNLVYDKAPAELCPWDFCQVSLKSWAKPSGIAAIYGCILIWSGKFDIRNWSLKPCGDEGESMSNGCCESKRQGQFDGKRAHMPFLRPAALQKGNKILALLLNKLAQNQKWITARLNRFAAASELLQSPVIQFPWDMFGASCSSTWNKEDIPHINLTSY